MKTKNIIMLTAAGIAAGAAGAALYLMTRPTIHGTVQAVRDFDAESYLGKWYEIARLDYKFERGLSRVTAEYSLNHDGSIKVVNSGYDAAKRQWQSAEGKAVFAKTRDIGMLKVSFFGPFYAGYNVAAIDKDYKYALVFGRNLNYMWLLSKEKTMPEKVIRDYLQIAADSGYDTSRLVWTVQ